MSEALGALEVDLFFHEANRARILRMRIVVEVAQIDNVDSESAEDRDPRRLVIQVVAIAELLVEIQMEMAGHDLVAGQRLEDIVVGVGQHRIVRGLSPAGAQVVVDRHVLLGAGGRIVQGEVVAFAARGADAVWSTLRRSRPRDGILLLCSGCMTPSENEFRCLCGNTRSRGWFHSRARRRTCAEEENGQRARTRIENHQAVARA